MIKTCVDVFDGQRFRVFVYEFRKLGFRLFPCRPIPYRHAQFIVPLTVVHRKSAHFRQVVLGYKERVGIDFFNVFTHIAHNVDGIAETFRIASLVNIAYVHSPRVDIIRRFQIGFYYTVVVFINNRAGFIR